MVFLKKYSILLIFTVLLGNNLLFSQNKEQIDAFAKSYEYEQVRDFQKAINELKNIYDAKSYEINMRLAWLHYNAGLFSESTTYYRKSISLMPYSEEAYLGLIYPASAMGKWDIVINSYKKILQNSPNNTSVNYKLGSIYYGKKKYTQAYKYFKVIIDLYPFSYDGLLMFAWTNYQLGKYQEAKLLFTKVLLLSPNDASALEGLSMIK